ncbi:T9SS type A sorting domain-containing protein [Candidatus Poribacteria bacterium]|nr:T9SS type A sorting domain-containing protein [Candidatus Poribacteria bacterium]
MNTKKQHVILFFLTLLLLMFVSYVNAYMKWDLPEGAKLRIGKGGISNLTFSPDGERLIVGCYNGIWTYDAQSGLALDFISTYGKDLIAVSPNAKMFVCVETENRFHIRSILDGSLIAEIEADTSPRRTVAITHDGNTFAAGIGKEIVLWDIPSGERISTLVGHTGSVSSLAFSPDGKSIVSGNWSDTVRLWDITTATQKKKLTYHRNSITKVIFSPNGSKVASISVNEKRVNIWDVVNEKHHTIQVKESTYGIAFSPDGSTIAIGDRSGRLYLWNVESWEHITEFTGHKKESVYAIVFSPNGTTLASGSSDSLFIWDVSTGKRNLTIKGHTTGIRALAFSPDGKILATGSPYQINLWNTTSTERIEQIYFNEWYNYFISLVFSPDGNLLASQDGRRTLIWDVNLLTHLRTLTGNGGKNLTSTTYLAGLEYSPNGQLLAGGNELNTAVQIWYKGRTHIDAFIGHTAGVTSVKFSPDGTILASSSNDKTVRIWDVSTGSNITTLNGHLDRVHCVDFNEDGSILASCGKDNSIIFWDMSSGESRIVSSAHKEEVRKIAFSMDGKQIVSCGGWGDPIVKIWDVDSGDMIKTLIGHGHTVLDVAFSLDGDTLATGSPDGTVMLWDYVSIMDPIEEITNLPADVNRDGVVDLQDLIYIALQFGKSQNSADINEDGIVNIEDLLFVAAALNDESSAPQAYFTSKQSITPAIIQEWLKQAQSVKSMTPTLVSGISVLEKLYLQITPEKTAVLPNYPNPFNPETWIPYELSEPSDVTIRIYTIKGQLIRRLQIGHQQPGEYHSPSRAAYWDGKNELGENVANGIYFYVFIAGNFSATKQMVILK